MPATSDELIAFLSGLGTEQVAHTEGTFLTHLIGVYRDLHSWGCDESLCCAGMFHSIYGTERFQKFALPLERRDEVRRLIGERAERLAYLNCVMDRASLDREVERGTGPYSITDRLSQQRVELTADEFDDLCRVHLCDWLEQVPRSKHWDYRRAAYQRMAARLGGVAQRSYDSVFSKEPVAAR
jgi:uncharacterized protein DUF6817